MPTAPPPASNQIRIVIAAACVISGLAFLLGQGVAAYQANLTSPHVASLVSRVNEQMTIAHGITPTPTVRGSIQRVATTSYTTKRTSASTANTAALVTDEPKDSAKDNHDQGNQDKQDKQDKQGNQDKHDNTSQDQSQHGSADGNVDSITNPGQPDITGKPNDSGNPSAPGQLNVSG